MKPHLLLLAAWMAVFAPSTSAADPAGSDGNPALLQPIRIGWQLPAATQGQIAQVLKRTNLLEAHGFDPLLIPFSFGGPQIEAALAGRLDALFAGDQPAVNLIARGGRWKIVGRLFYDRFALLVPPHSPIRKVAHLRGKVVASPFGSSAHREAVLQEAAAGLAPESEVKNRDADILEIRRRLLPGGSGRWGGFDAVAAWEPTVSQVELQGSGRILAASRTLGVIVLSEAFLQSRPDAAERFLMAIQRAWLFYARNTGRVMQWYIDEAQLGFTAEALRSAAALDPNTRAASLADIDARLSDGEIAALQRAIDWARTWERMPVRLEAGQIVDQSPLERATRRLAAESLPEPVVVLPSAREAPAEYAVPMRSPRPLPPWLLALALIVVSLLAIQSGQWIGGRLARRHEGETEGPIGTVVGAVLALLAFVIALTFSAAGGRFEARKQTLLDEVNAIGTAYLRAGLLPEPQRSTSRLLLRDYVETRLGMSRLYDQPEKLSIVQNRTQSLQESIWNGAVELAEKGLVTPVHALYLSALNSVFDLHTQRVVLGAEYRIPSFVWLALGIVSILAMALVGYQFGLGSRRSPFTNVALSIVFALVVFLIYDFDNPGEGFIEVNQQPMIELYQSLGRQAG